jgi:hypothetical protein
MERWYTPKSYQNREKPENDKVEWLIHHPSTAEFEEFAGSREKPTDSIGLVKKFLKQIKNLNANGKAIISGEEMVNEVPRHLVKDYVEEAYITIVTGLELPGGEEKNSEGLSI